MSDEIFDQVKIVEESLNNFAVQICAEIDGQHDWINRIDHPIHPASYALCKDKILTSNERLHDLYEENLEISKEFQQHFDDLIELKGINFVYTTPLPFVLSLMNADYEKIQKYLGYMKEAAITASRSHNRTFASLRVWLNHNRKIFTVFMPNRYTTYFRLTIANTSAE